MSSGTSQVAAALDQPERIDQYPGAAPHDLPIGIGTVLKRCHGGSRRFFFPTSDEKIKLLYHIEPS
ncbi:hypothetical protein MTX26_35560 (plasmid) [Bradyrhizobium sp. ISRA443]|uniref:hypothetical protein n=1 Tax=unclassified Bradyrhizobium TaxID=2631580 RepID=UPI00247842D9|nr:MULTISPECIES: hypothetical protein [unclassified Bradyrhizobium]WGR90742.1 hypothetical protein MTX20_01430 [Bradyrhizobium sp. ISRA435]WGS03126.1 hypothetical protein MTX23_35060 [Bradyrhizobium sp. ISRA436]WGS10080.1 hypothetical protein MTX18_35560 [Bradyrhizobium sp. ISRA437]WGS16965.1 hypothetical protein MTX26_35560 [Bradyrhizobium sp. ISRA443]